MLLLITLVIFSSCPHKHVQQQEKEVVPVLNNGVRIDTIETPPPIPLVFPPGTLQINTGSTTPEELLAFAKTLTGITYKYASVDPSVGFDCSGFITYVFNHFNIVVPRSSIDFTNVEREISLADAKPGDIVLFTGTDLDSTARKVGHMGIITSNENGACYFIHSTSGKAYGVTTTLLSKHYAMRFVKVIRIFPQNDTNL